MKETRFIAQNKEKWQQSETLLTEAEKDPEKLSELFTQVLEDLSYSRTYYPNRSVRVYLNRIAREYFSIIYSQHRSRRNTFKHFWLDEIPHIVYQSRRPLFISLIIFLVSVFIGVFSSINDPQFASTILGDSYVEMTKANIEKGDPMAVYKEAHEVDMFLGITFNNLMVAFRTYVFGLFFSIGTVAILLSNGIMVGCFQFFFIERGLLAESALTIWLHGTLEISSIILAGGAGLTLGSGLLFPGTYSRLQAFQITAMRSLKLMIGIAPIFVLAAVIESFLTRYTDVPDVIRFMLIALSGTFILGYFVYYPWMKARIGFDQVQGDEKLPPSSATHLSFERIKTNGEVINDTFSFYKKYSRRLLSWSVLITVLMATAEFFAPLERVWFMFSYDAFWSFIDNVYYAVKTAHPVYIAINTIGTSLILYRVFHIIAVESNSGGRRNFRIVAIIQGVLIIGMLYSAIYFLGGWGVLLVFLAWLLFLFLSFVQFLEQSWLPLSISRTIALLSENFAQVVTLQLVLIMMSFSFLVIVSAPVLYFNTQILEWNFAASDTWAGGIAHFVEIFLKLLGFNLVLPIFGCSAAWLYFSLREIHTADHLKSAIERVGLRHSKASSK